MPEPATLNLTVHAGDDYDHHVTFVTEAGAPIPLAGTYRAELRESPSGPLVATFTVDASNVDGGVLVLALTAATTRTLPPVCRWDLERTLNGRVTTLLKGYLVVTPDITKVVV